MGFLKKLGGVLAKGIGYVTGFGPLVASSIPGDKDDAIIGKVTDSLNEVAGIVVTVQAVGETLGTDGPEKLKAATPLIANIVVRSALVAGRPIENQALFLEGCTDLTNAVYKILESQKADEVKTKLEFKA